MRYTAAAMLCLMLAAPGAAEEDRHWTFGIGTAPTSFSIDGEVGFVTPSGGAIFDVDLDNGDTADLAESAFGVGGFASNGRIRIVYSLKTTTLADRAGGLDAEWDRKQAEVAVVVGIGRAGRHGFGVLGGVRHNEHEWTFETPAGDIDVDESWTDALVGLSHVFRFGERWNWSNGFDVGLGDSEQALRFRSGVGRTIGDHWQVQFAVHRFRLEFGDRADVGRPDFYLYDVDETGLSVGFLYLF